MGKNALVWGSFPSIRTILCLQVRINRQVRIKIVSMRQEQLNTILCWPIPSSLAFSILQTPECSNFAQRLSKLSMKSASSVPDAFSFCHVSTYCVLLHFVLWYCQLSQFLREERNAFRVSYASEGFCSRTHFVAARAEMKLFAVLSHITALDIHMQGDVTWVKINWTLWMICISM